MKKRFFISVLLLCSVVLSFAQSKKDMLLRIEEQNAAINSLNQQVGALTAQREQLSEQVNELKKQVDDLKALIAATNESKLINTGWTKRGDFYSGLALIQDDTSNKYGFIDKTGKVVIPCEWKQASTFNSYLEGLAEVQNENGLWGFIDASGKVVIPCEWGSIDLIYNFDLAAVKNTENGLWGFIDKTGKVVIPCECIDYYRLTENGRVHVKKKNGDHVYIDRTGREYKSFY